MTTREYQNVHGRRGGRGSRPYLLMLKLVCVAIFFGGLVSLLVLTLLPTPTTTIPAWRDRAEVIHRAFIQLIIPALVGAIIAGVLLVASIWRVLIRMRWFQLKMVLIALGAPALHLFMRSRFLSLSHLLAERQPDLDAARALRGQLLVATLTAITLALAVVCLGRIKPRLGRP